MKKRVSKSRKDDSMKVLVARGRIRKKNSGRKGWSRSKSKSMGNNKCFKCNKEGHYVKNDPDHKEKKNEKTSNFGDVAVAEENSNITYVLLVTVNNWGDEWIIDSKCSYHLSPNRDWFNIYQPIDGGNILMGNDVVCKVVEIDTIQIKMYDGIIRTLIDARHVPELKTILISLGIPDSNGCTYKFEGGVLRILNGALVVMKWKKINGLYIL